MTKRYELTPEHRAQLAPWTTKWIGHGMSTEPVDPPRVRAAVTALYQAAKLTPPPPERIVIVPSPFVLAFAGSLAMTVWESRTARAKVPAPAPPARKAPTTGEMDRWWTGVDIDGLQAVAESFRVTSPSWAKAFGAWNGGNQWAGWVAYLSFFRHIAKLPIDYTAWAPYEELALCSGPRVVHAQFCMVSDRPRVLTVDSQNRPHNDTGPFCEWRDGSALWALHGARVPAKYVLTRAEDIDAQWVVKETNAECRRELVRKIGIERVCGDLGAKVLDRQDDYELLSLELGDGRRRPYLKMRNPSIGVYHIEGVGPECDTVSKALAWRNGTSQKPQVLT